MAPNTGKGSRIGAAKNRTQIENPKTGDYIKRNEEPDSSHKGLSKKTASTLKV